MSLKKVKIFAVFGIFFLCFFTHFLYDWFPNSFFALVFPVNESVWEHMKMLFTTILLYGGIDYFLLKKFSISFCNFFIQLGLTAIMSIPIYLVLFLPIYYHIGEKMWISLIVLFFTLSVIQILSYFILLQKRIRFVSYGMVFLLIFCYCVFGYLTYHPIENDLFFDPKEEKYGMYKYIL